LEYEKDLLTWEDGGCEASHSPRAGGTFSMRSSHVVLDQVDITFDVPRAIAHAGLLLPATWPSGWGSRRPLTSSSTSVTAPARRAPAASC